MQRYDTVAEDLVLRPSGPGFPRTQTVEWAPSVARRRNRPAQSPLATHHETITSIDPWIAEDYRECHLPMFTLLRRYQSYSYESYRIRPSAIARSSTFHIYARHDPNVDASERQG